MYVRCLHAGKSYCMTDKSTTMGGWSVDSLLHRLAAGIRDFNLATDSCAFMQSEGSIHKLAGQCALKDITPENGILDLVIREKDTEVEAITNKVTLGNCIPSPLWIC